MKVFRQKWDSVKSSCKKYLKEGLSPHKIAFTVSVGLIMGIIPIPGITIMLCILMTIIFKLNHILIQSINMLVYPLQLLLLFPFYKMGNMAFTRSGSAINAFDFSRLSFTNVWELLGKSTINALLLWILISIPLGLICYFFLKKALVIYHLQRSSKSSFNFTDSFSQQSS